MTSKGAGIINMAGQRFGNVLAICVVGTSSSGDKKWKFICDCGEEFAANGYAVRSGKTRTCPACSKKRVARASLTHGKTTTKEYSTWTDIQTRCHNPNCAEFPNYGGRGIQVCSAWRQSFELFLSDMGPKPSPAHSIDRIDNDGNYEPLNCRWATRQEQANNKRTSVRVNGEPLAAIARRLGIKYGTLHHRVKYGRGDYPAEAPQAMTLTHEGIVDTISGWSKRTGIKASTITMRVTKYGWPVGKALTKEASK